MMEIYVLDAIALATALFCIRSWNVWRKQSFRTASYPPGPKGLPIIGNIFNMPGKDEWEAARQWGEQYGDLVFFENFSTRYLFVNSYEAAVDLFEKRGHLFSTRPQTTMIDLGDWQSWFSPQMRYGDDLRKIRQYLHRFFQQTVNKNYYVVQTQSSHKLLFDLLRDPDGFRDHIRYSAADSIVKITFGYEVVENDPYVELVDKGMEAVYEAQTFFLVNALPILRYLPTWFPGATFHKRAKEGHELSIAMYRKPYDKAKAMIADSTAAPSMTSKLIDSNTDGDGNVVDEDIIMKAVSIAYAAGGDTTVSVLLTFFLAMVLHPEPMRKGQEELDRVIGKDNLPTFEDREKLPYIDAICKECLRWQTVTAAGVAHSSDEDDIYNGFLIPAGTTIFANVWAMLRNPKEYPEPEKFIPERWLTAKPPMHPNKMAFGFGRRICPGRHLAENSVYIGIASILAVFNIEKAVDTSGVPITPVENYTSNIVRHPKPFACKITPRSDDAAALIRAAYSALK